jgi:hypothetical protein
MRTRMSGGVGGGLTPPYPDYGMADRSRENADCLFQAICQDDAWRYHRHVSSVLRQMPSTAGSITVLAVLRFR